MLAAEPDGNLVLTRHRLGDAGDTSRVASARHPRLGSIEHALAGDRRVLVPVDAAPGEATAPLRLAAGWSVAAVHRGSRAGGAIGAAAFDAAAIEIARG
ncbi:hypothetical protein [Phycisphaera mikurensis]|uniref:hypothetical protein n=1 Tax=Phycisphaera mikurensis TaxID=547188 RepID=UPI00059D9741|nr:hypothetical protein [Phycisphaera mikurensis]MBB6441125.1 hypothetical protein [Phycisphaera mikurensis]